MSKTLGSAQSNMYAHTQGNNNDDNIKHKIIICSVEEGRINSNRTSMLLTWNG
jgi:hypothetical protein